MRSPSQPGIHSTDHSEEPQGFGRVTPWRSGCWPTRLTAVKCIATAAAANALPPSPWKLTGLHVPVARHSRRALVTPDNRATRNSTIEGESGPYASIIVQPKKSSGKPVCRFLRHHLRLPQRPVRQPSACHENSCAMALTEICRSVPCGRRKAAAGQPTKHRRDPLRERRRQNRWPQRRAGTA